MECYNIDTSYTEYSNNEVFKMIKMILSDEVKEINTSGHANFTRIIS
jgi:esterase/lipase superfamily enzyme